MARVIFLFTLSPAIAGIGDSAYYYYTSNLIAQGQGYTEPFRLMFYNQHDPTALHPPLWSAVLAVLSLFTGPGSGVGQLGGSALALHRILGCAVGAFVVVLVGLLGRRIGGTRVGLVAAGLAALYPRFLILDASLTDETLFAAVVGVLLLMAYRFVDRPTRGRAVGLGVLVGLAALTHEEGLLFLPALLIPLAWRVGRPARWPMMGMAVLGTLIVIVPWSGAQLRGVSRIRAGGELGRGDCRGELSHHVLRPPDRLVAGLLPRSAPQLERGGRVQPAALGGDQVRPSSIRVRCWWPGAVTPRLEPVRAEQLLGRQPDGAGPGTFVITRS